MARLASHSLGYCTNVHPGESWADVRENLRAQATQVRAQWKHSDRWLGLGVWLSAQAARELLAPQSQSAWREFEELCHRELLTIPSLNGFPIGGFHGTRVKESVYRPDWTAQGRLQYTRDLIRVATRLGTLAGPTGEVSISTLPISYRAWIGDPAMLDHAADSLAAAVLELSHAEDHSGTRAHLALEPEPDCVLETSRDVIRFFNEYLLPVALPSLRRQGGLSPSRAEALLRDKLRVCYDTCHAAVAFERPLDALDGYAAHGIQVGKVQLSSALRVACVDGRTEDGSLITELLEPFSHDRYLHQVIGREAGRAVRFADLPAALIAWRERPPTGEYRVHCHVPIFWEGTGALGTTQDHLIELLAITAERPVARHWEVETYTWEVLPEVLRSGDLPSRIARELNWI